MGETRTRLPGRGVPRDEVLRRMETFRGDDADWRTGKTWSLVYYGGEEHTAFLKQAYDLYFSENGLNPMAFKSLKRFETETVRMAAGLLNGGPDTVGCMTSGGTESCMLAVKTYRDRALAQRRWPGTPELIVPTTVHVAFDKAAEYFGVKLVRAPVGPDFRVDVKAMKRRINRRTIGLVASAPPYPHGVVDPIEEIGRIAARRGLPFHVDACLGGFMLPFVEKLGYPVPPFDFRIPGVTSMSADLHKYGYAAKGASLILYRDMSYMEHQFFVYENWPGGVFASPALLGTRPGGSIAAAWATLMATGEDGYLRRAKAAMDTTRALRDGVESVPGLEVLGDPTMTVFSYRSTDPAVNVYAVADRMEARGWHLDRQQKPDALHVMVSAAHVGLEERYLTDLRDAVGEVRADPALATSGGAATYGMISAVPLRGMIRKQVLKMMMDAYGPGDGGIDLDAPADDLATKAGVLLVKAREELRGRLGR